MISKLTFNIRESKSKEKSIFYTLFVFNGGSHIVFIQKTMPRTSRTNEFVQL